MVRRFAVFFVSFIKFEDLRAINHRLGTDLQWPRILLIRLDNFILFDETIARTLITFLLFYILLVNSYVRGEL